MFDWYDLNARHVASFIWLGLFLLFFVVASPDVRRGLGAVMTSALSKQLLPVFSGLLVVAGVGTFVGVVLGSWASYWVALPIVTAAVWTTGSGVGLLTNYDGFLRKEETFAKTVRRIVVPPAVVAALVGASTLSFTLEMILVPVVAVIGLLHAFSRTDQQYRPVEILTAVLLVLYVLGLIALLVKDAVADVDNLKLASQAVLVPVWLTLWVVPYLRLIIVVEQVKFLLSAKRKTIRRSDYGESWPLTVEKARLCCRFRAVWVEVGLKRYSLNGTSKTFLPRYGLKVLELEEIWREDPAGERIRELLEDDEDWSPWRVNIGDLITEGLALEEGH
ncbi:MAG: DUF2511 domain-containing protein [Chloroflexota bacterium]|nr:DUF2511 domain-containing protein [Chloroflexota bacterium]